MCLGEEGGLCVRYVCGCRVFVKGVGWSVEGDVGYEVCVGADGVGDVGCWVIW